MDLKRRKQTNSKPCLFYCLFLNGFCILLVSLIALVLFSDKLILPEIQHISTLHLGVCRVLYPGTFRSCWINCSTSCDPCNLPYKCSNHLQFHREGSCCFGECCSNHSQIESKGSCLVPQTCIVSCKDMWSNNATVSYEGTSPSEEDCSLGGGFIISPLISDHFKTNSDFVCYYSNTDCSIFHSQIPSIPEWKLVVFWSLFTLFILDSFLLQAKCVYQFKNEIWVAFSWSILVWLVVVLPLCGVLISALTDERVIDHETKRKVILGSGSLSGLSLFLFFLMRNIVPLNIPNIMSGSFLGLAVLLLPMVVLHWHSPTPSIYCEVLLGFSLISTIFWGVLGALQKPQPAVDFARIGAKIDQSVPEHHNEMDIVLSVGCSALPLMKKAVNNITLSDITLLVELHPVHAHRAVIFARAPKWYSELEENEKIVGGAYVYGVKQWCLIKILELIYTGSTSIPSKGIRRNEFREILKVFERKYNLNFSSNIIDKVNEDGEFVLDLDFKDVLSDYAKLYEEPNYADFILISQGSTFKIHKIMVYFKVPYFMAMLEPEWNTRTDTTEEFQVYCEANVLNVIIYFCYFDELPSNVNGETILKVLIQADNFGFVKLRDVCTHYIQSKTSDTFLFHTAKALKIESVLSLYEEEKSFRLSSYADPYYTESISEK